MLGLGREEGNKMLENIIIWLKTPFGEEVSLSLVLSLISSVLILWGASKLFKFKKNNFLTALLVGSLFTLTNFLIRLINLIFNLSDAQKPTANIIGMIVSSIILIILLITVYKANWWKTILSWMAVFYGKFLFMGIVMVIVMFSFPAFMEFDSAPTIKAGISDFYIHDLDEVGIETGNNQFTVYQSKIRTPISIRAVHVKTDIAFNSRTEGVTMDISCKTPEEILFSSIQNNEIHEFEGGEYYEFGSEEQFKSSKGDFSFNFWGQAYFSCGEICTKEKTTFNMKGLFDESIEYSTKSKIAEMNTGRKSMGTKMLYIERRKPMHAFIVFVFEGNESKTLDCNLHIITEKPSQTIKKSFTIEYIAD